MSLKKAVSTIGRAGMLGFVTLSMANAALAQGKIDASVGYYPGAMLSLSAFIGADKGFYEKHGLNVELVPVPNGAAMTAALVSGSIDFANNSYDNLTTAVSKRLPIKTIVGALVRSPLSLVVREGYPLENAQQGYPTSMQDLKGAKLGVIGLGISVHFMMEMLAQGAGLEEKDYTIVAVGLPNSARPALKNGSVDAYLSLWPLPAIMEATNEGKVLIDLIQDQGPEKLQGLAYQSWWATNKSIESKHEMVTRFVRASQDAYCWYSKPENLGEVVEVLKKNVPVPELSDEQYTAMVKTMLPAYDVRIPAQSIVSWQQILIEQGVIKSEVSLGDLVVPEAMQDFECPAA